MIDIKAMRERHQPFSYKILISGEVRQRCSYDRDRWPCDTNQALDLLEQARELLDEAHRTVPTHMEYAVGHIVGCPGCRIEDLLAKLEGHA